MTQWIADNPKLSHEDEHRIQLINKFKKKIIFTRTNSIPIISKTKRKRECHKRIENFKHSHEDEPNLVDQQMKEEDYIHEDKQYSNDQ